MTIVTSGLPLDGSLIFSSLARLLCVTVLVAVIVLLWTFIWVRKSSIAAAFSFVFEG